MYSLEDYNTGEILRFRIEELIEIWKERCAEQECILELQGILKEQDRYWEEG